MRLLCAALCAAFFATGAHAVSDMGDKSEWYACEKDADCAIERDYCSNLASINKQHQSVYQKWAHLTGTMVSCETSLPILNQEQLHAVCAEKICTINPQPQFGERKRRE